MMWKHSIFRVSQDKCKVFVLFIKFYSKHFEHFAG